MRRRSWGSRAWGPTAVALALVAAGAAVALSVQLAKAGPETTLLDPGAEPRVTLRFELDEGTSTDYVITTDRSDRLTVDGEAEPRERTASTALGTRTVTGVAADGRYLIETFTAIDGGRPLKAGAPDVDVRPWLMDDRGRIWEAGASEGPDGPASLILPEEPVGVGATWETVAIAGGPLGGEPVFEATTVTTTTLVDILPDGRYALRGEVVMTASDQAVPSSRLPDGVTAVYDQIDLAGEYRWLLDPSDPVVLSDGHIEGSTSVVVTMDGLARTYLSESVADVAIDPADGTPE